MLQWVTREERLKKFQYFPRRGCSSQGAGGGPPLCSSRERRSLPGSGGGPQAGEEQQDDDFSIGLQSRCSWIVWRLGKTEPSSWWGSKGWSKRSGAQMGRQGPQRPCSSRAEANSILPRWAAGGGHQIQPAFGGGASLGVSRGAQAAENGVFIEEGKHSDQVPLF